jgi:hypothetical protein
MTAVLALSTGCDDGSAITGPLLDVDGEWSVLRTAESGEGCDARSDLRPVIMTVRTMESQLEIEAPRIAEITDIFRGSLQSDGEFELHWEEESPGFSSARATLRGRFVGDAFTAMEAGELVLFDPTLSELLGSDHCETTVLWEGERIRP